MTNDNISDILSANVIEYNGKHSEIIKKIPLLYTTAVQLLKDVQIHSEYRLKLLAAIGYIIIPNDIYPEDEHGPIGYVEDIMLLIHLFREINNARGKTPLLRNWEGNEDELKKILVNDFEELKNAFPRLFEEVIKFTGV